MRSKIAYTILSMAIVQATLADPNVEQLQQALKEQGFYYGEITGQKNTDTIAAIRRFQIRNGLQVTGELNPETLQALNSGASKAPTITATPAPHATVSPEQDTVAPAVPRGEEIYSPPPRSPSSNIFNNTPYEMAPPDVQQRVIRGAQMLLRHQGYFKGSIDGLYGAELEFSLRAYQSRTGIPPNGRLDMDTLASLGLLPGQQFHARRLAPRRILPRPLDQPPVRGEWIPETRDRDEDND